MIRRRHALVSATAAALVGALAFAAPAAAADVAQYPFEASPGLTIASPFPNYVMEVDCAAYTFTPEFDPLALVWVPGGSLEVRFTCDPEEITGDALDASATDFPSDVRAVVAPSPFVSAYTIAPNSIMSFKIEASDESSQFISFAASAELSDPSGTRIVSETATIPAGAGSAIVYDFENADCFLEGPRVHEAIEFTVLEAGEFTFRIVDVDPLQTGADTGDGFDGYDPNPWGDYMPIIDPYLVLYSAFDPSNPSVGIIGCNDDSDRVHDETPAFFEMYDSLDRFISEYYSEVIADLAPGTYTLVVTTYDEIGEIVSSSTPAKSEVASSVLLPAEYNAETLPEQSATVEFWGAEGGLVLGAQLAATGPDTRGLAALAAFAALFVLTGVVVMRSRTA